MDQQTQRGRTINQGPVRQPEQTQSNMLLMICQPQPKKKMLVPKSLERVSESDINAPLDSVKHEEYTPARNSTQVDDGEQNFDILMAKLDSLRQS